MHASLITLTNQQIRVQLGSLPTVASTRRIHNDQSGRAGVGWREGEDGESGQEGEVGG